MAFTWRTIVQWMPCLLFCIKLLWHLPGANELTHWGRVTHICIRKLTIIGSDNGFSPGRRQAIIWTNAGILLIRTSGTNFSEILNEIHTFSFKKMHLNMSSGKRRPSCLSLNVLKVNHVIYASLSQNEWRLFCIISVQLCQKLPNVKNLGLDKMWVYVQGWGSLKLCSLFTPLAIFSIVQNYLLDPCNHVHIWQGRPQHCCGHTCQIWAWYLKGNSHFDNPEILGK